MRTRKNGSHGHSCVGKRTTEYNTWLHMKDRCFNPNNNGYANYGGRGITICDRWLGETGFENFLSDMGHKPSPKHSIDRINNDGNYEPSNCRWATAATQVNNRSINVKFTFYGCERTLAEWSRISQIHPHTIDYRLSRGWSPKEAIWRPTIHPTRVRWNSPRKAGV